MEFSQRGAGAFWSTVCGDLLDPARVARPSGVIRRPAAPQGSLELERAARCPAAVSAARPYFQLATHSPPMLTVECPRARATWSLAAWCCTCCTACRRTCLVHGLLNGRRKQTMHFHPRSWCQHLLVLPMEGENPCTRSSPTNLNLRK